MTHPPPSALPPPARPRRRVRWLWRNEHAGYGNLLIGVETPRGWVECVYFAQPVKGRGGRVYALVPLTLGTPDEEFVVDLVAWSCGCEGFFRRGDCSCIRAMAMLDHQGRL